MSATIFRRVEIPENNDLVGFSLTADYYKYGATYILGLASLISRDPLTAFNMHYSLLQEIGNNNDKLLINIKKFLPIRITEAALLCARLSLIEKKYNYLEEANKYLGILKNFDPNNYTAHLLRAIYHFMSNRNIKAAEKEIKMAKNKKDGSWKFSQAFLLAYKGKLDEAHNMYMKAFNSNYSGYFILEIEKFIEDVFNEEGSKTELLYCLGLINYYSKDDHKLAYYYWNKFIGNQKMKNLYTSRIRFVEEKLKK